MKHTAAMILGLAAAYGSMQPVRVRRSPMGPYQCKCGARFAGKIALKQHMKSKHSARKASNG